MLRTCDSGFDAAAAISQGRRDHQEDALITDFPIGSDMGFVVLSDGMGGHAAGDVASKIAVTEVFSELKLRSGNVAAFEDGAPQILCEVAHAANACIRAHSQGQAETRGMGATLLALAFVKDRLFWISVGDSPLYLFRDGALRQINEDHSAGPQIDMLARAGRMTEEEARAHPDRNCLTSVLCGGDIPRIDCPAEPLALLEDDLLIAASDGLQFLPHDVIGEILKVHRYKTSREIAHALLDALRQQDYDDQDNVALSVVRAAPPRFAEHTLPDTAEARFIPEHRDAGTAAARRPSLMRGLFSLRGLAFSRNEG
ncbi:serine/threonine-protein phosphatase [Maritimibacter sp. 55A14]|uniref:PP2C family protein-serine/threonine phosphatase n=1 Tax=Maritimibacter sp. 55A14 TaxID=2174844 RepID=UPI000D613430|nr:protein phosphatase 2C domain-containing protein [Maritimibacter sp. 55A14]PWE31397.1 serine/threonine-protein phosphatase [Maritimibacter sp. 55A14]